MERIKELLNTLHEKGIKLPYFRDPIKGTPSVSLTMLVISFFIYLLCLVNKFAGFFGGVDLDGSFQLLILAASLYFGRSFASTGKGKANLGEKKDG